MDEKTQADTPTCVSCGNTSNQAALFRALINNVEQWVCARCLPRLIHGAH